LPSPSLEQRLAESDKDGMINILFCSKI